MRPRNSRLRTYCDPLLQGKDAGIHATTSGLVSVHMRGVTIDRLVYKDPAADGPAPAPEAGLLLGIRRQASLTNAERPDSEAHSLVATCHTVNPLSLCLCDP